MPEVVWTENAVEDLESIIRFIAKDSPHYARMFADKIFKIADKLAHFPFIGRSVAEFETSDVRRITYGNIRLLYRAQKNGKRVEILTLYQETMLPDLGDMLK